MRSWCLRTRGEEVWGVGGVPTSADVTLASTALARPPAPMPMYGPDQFKDGSAFGTGAANSGGGRSAARVRAPGSAAMIPIAMRIFLIRSRHTAGKARTGRRYQLEIRSVRIAKSPRIVITARSTELRTPPRIVVFVGPCCSNVTGGCYSRVKSSGTDQGKIAPVHVGGRSQPGRADIAEGPSSTNCCSRVG